MDVFKPSEVLSFATRMEKNGEKYYRRFAETLQQAQVKDLFLHLAEQEARHKAIFEEMLSKTEDVRPPTRQPDEYLDYLRAYVDEVVFASTTLEGEAQLVRDPVTALEFGMRRETDSIFYYHEVMKFVSEEKQGTVEEIIEEEQRHYARLHEMKKLYRAAR